MAAALALRSGAHRPVEVADHILKHGEPRRLPGFELNRWDAIADPRLCQPIAAGYVVEVFDKEAVTARQRAAVRFDIIDGCQARAEAERADEVEYAISRIFQQDMLLKIGRRTTMSHQLQAALPREQGCRGRWFREIDAQRREAAGLLPQAGNAARREAGGIDVRTTGKGDGPVSRGSRPLRAAGNGIYRAAYREGDRRVGSKQRVRRRRCLERTCNDK